jgi:hypothetical protein
MNPRKFFTLITILFTANLIAGQIVLAQTSQGTQQSGLTQQLNPGNFGISHIPASFSFSQIHIQRPGNSYSYYITSPDSQKNYISIYDGRYDGGIKLSVQVTNHFSQTSQISLTQESAIVSNFSATQEVKESTPAVTTENLLYYSETTPTEATTFQPFPENGILVLLDAPTANTGQGRVGTFTLYPSYKLTIPDTTPAGTYQSTITYTIEDSID